MIIEVDVPPEPAAARRVPRRWWISLGAIAVLVAALGLFVSRGTNDLRVVDPGFVGGKSIAVSLPQPNSIVRKGVTYTVAQVDADAASAPAGNELDVYVFAATGGSPACTELNPSARVIRQSADGVVVATFAYATPKPRRGTYACSFFGDDRNPLVRKLRLHLSAPLGGRRVVGARDGYQIGVVGRFRDRMPSYVPTGYHRVGGSDDGRFDPSSLFYAVTQFERGAATIEIHTTSANAVHQNDHARKITDINGQPALVDDSSDGRCVSWDQGDGFGYEVCSMTEHSPRLGVATLAKIARSLR